MEVNSIWNKRFKDFYIEMANYFAVIAMSVLYSFIIFGSVFIYFYMKFIQWLPPSVSTEIIAAVVITFIFLQTRVRTFVKKADVVFLMPTEAALSSYFRNSILYSVFMDVIRLLIFMIVMSPLIKNKEVINLPFVLIILGLIILNIRLTWVEQWLTTKTQKVVHRSIRLILFSTALYFMFLGIWEISGIVIVVNFIIWFYVFGKRARGINWSFLINQEEKSKLKIYKFISLYIDVRHLERSFSRRRLLGWIVKKVVTHKQSSSHVYLFSHLFVRYDDFYYLYVRLSLIGFSIIYFLPDYGWIVALLLLFLTGYQLLPLQYSVNDSIRLYPISFNIFKKSFKKLIMNLLILQLIIINLALLIHVPEMKTFFSIVIELLFVYWFVHSFASKRISKDSIS
ncbi:ABC transporter permease [Sporosarcina limicola]|uniref:ABC-2 type transport system permease protein n=1 Tax=Sporosarcina limicola TaxID=34101 RepID=A0A927MII8_9BACL|nr:ABC transporter permease [Sporosarcina limicola]MBE1555248.1 ABC-2 type transport system permease protein [Sporosarcina limicola]